MRKLSVSLASLMLFVSCADASGETTTPAAYVVSGYVHAGPMCPVVQDPPDPSCEDRPVEGATIVVENSAGVEVGRVTTSADGTFSIRLIPGHYTLVPQPVEGLLGTAAPQDLVIEEASVDTLDFAYDTGIR